MVTEMVSTRSDRTNYTVNWPSDCKPFKSPKAPIFRYFQHLKGPAKSQMLKEQLAPVNEMVIFFHWFLQQMVPRKIVGVEETFEDLLSSNLKKCTRPKCFLRSSALMYETPHFKPL